MRTTLIAALLAALVAAEPSHLYGNNWGFPNIYGYGYGIPYVGVNSFTNRFYPLSYGYGYRYGYPYGLGHHHHHIVRRSASPEPQVQRRYGTPVVSLNGGIFGTGLIRGQSGLNGDQRGYRLAGNNRLSSTLGNTWVYRVSGNDGLFGHTGIYGNNLNGLYNNYGYGLGYGYPTYYYAVRRPAYGNYIEYNG